MPKNYNILLAGFGGQGILFLGKVIAYSGMLEGKMVSWFPSYGPEMRGGTANCSVCVSDKPIGSPIVLEPNVFMAMNLPSFDRFINDVEKGAIVIVDSSLINKRIERSDVKAFYIPATEIANDNGLTGLANMVLLGKFIKETDFCSENVLNEAFFKCIPNSKSDLFDKNKRAVRIGMSL